MSSILVRDSGPRFSTAILDRDSRPRFSTAILGSDRALMPAGNSLHELFRRSPTLLLAALVIKREVSFPRQAMPDQEPRYHKAIRSELGY
jgi:hypothetical protein